MRRPRFRKPSPPMAGGTGPGDGSDPRFDRRGTTRRPARKTLQLCGQVGRTIELVLAEQPDDLLRNLAVVRVEPAPDESRLLVTVGPLVPGARLDPAAASRRLSEASARLRNEVAAAITRRRTPALIFQVAAAEG